MVGTYQMQVSTSAQPWVLLEHNLFHPVQCESSYRVPVAAEGPWEDTCLICK